MKIKKKLANTKEKIANKRTICEVHRQIYDLIVINLMNQNPKLFKELENLLNEAYIYAKKMNMKLTQYKHGYGNDWWEEHKDKTLIEKLRTKRNKLLDKGKK